MFRLRVEYRIIGMGIVCGHGKGWKGANMKEKLILTFHRAFFVIWKNAIPRASLRMTRKS